MSEVFPPMLDQAAHRIIQPTIIQCNAGGFLVSIPGRGVAAKSTFEEAIKFLSQEVHRECYGRGLDLPVVVNKRFQELSTIAQVAIAAGFIYMPLAAFMAVSRWINAII